MTKKPEEQLTVDRKALIINLDERLYGTFAEIGAGQEVARRFFRVGGASGTVAKTMSAYDMKFSDEIYGKVGRYVSRDRLRTMLDHEYGLLIERLAADRGDRSCFFVFANTVAARNFKGTNECHGWLGVRFQQFPNQAPSDIVLHVRMTDREAILQQQALGIIGVNLLFAAVYFSEEPEILLRSLLDELTLDRIEVDMIEMSGPAVPTVDSRVLSLKLVQHQLTDAAMFGPDGVVLQPSEILYKKAVLVQRGSFRPVTKVAVDMLESAGRVFQREPEVALAKSEGRYVEILELTLNNLLSTGSEVNTDFLARAEMLSGLGYPVLISNYPEYYRLVSYFRRYTNQTLAMTLGVPMLLEVFNEKYYANLPGGILEAFGRMFKNEVRLYTYPATVNTLMRYLQSSGVALEGMPTSDEEIITTKNLPLPRRLRRLYRHLLEAGFVQDVEGYHKEYLSIHSADAFQYIADNDPRWLEMVPDSAAVSIRKQNLWGCTL